MFTPPTAPSKPIIVADVDGVLNPLRPGPHFKRHIVHPDCHWWNPEHNLSVWLNPFHGPWLSELASATGAQLVWGTGWEGEANAWIGPAIGLPELPVIPVPRQNGEQITFGAWKARQISAWAGRRPFVWFDDEPDACTAAAEHAQGEHLAVRVDPRYGLTRAHIFQATAFLAGATPPNPLES